MNSANDTFVRSVQALKAWLQYLDEQERDLEGKLARMKQNGKGEGGGMAQAPALNPEQLSGGGAASMAEEAGETAFEVEGTKAEKDQEDPWL